LAGRTKGRNRKHIANTERAFPKAQEAEKGGEVPEEVGTLGDGAQQKMGARQMGKCGTL